VKAVTAALALAALVALGIPGFAQALTAEELMQALSNVPSSRARFIETRHSAMLKKPLVLTGQLVYRRPDRLEKHVQSPFVESITIEGTRVSITRAGAEPDRMFTLPATGAAQALIESLRATLAGDLPALERHFAVAVSGTPGDWTMSLTPRDATLGAVVLRVDFAGKDNRVQRIEVLEAGGDRSVTTIKDEDR
jgi:outer membrane lipoprotein-sorting protein